MAAPLLMIPGPTTVPDEILAALAEPVRSHTSAENTATILRVQEVLRRCIGGADARIHAFAGSGTLAMEAALVNHARPGDRVVVVGHGYFGERFAEMGDAMGMAIEAIDAPWGEHVDPGALHDAVCDGPPPAVVTITHVDTSTGVLADVAALAGAVRDSGAIVVVDGVCATGGVEEAMDDWGVDVVATGAQKALGVPPGLAILGVSERARARRAGLGRIAAYYADLDRWDPVFGDPSQFYFSTHATSLLRAMEVSLDAIEREGLAERFARHRRLAERLRDGMGELGLEPMTDPLHLAPTLSVLAVPDGVDEACLRAAMAARGVAVAGCLGSFAGRGIRVGHMGYLGDTEIDRTLEAASGALLEQS